MLPHASDPSIAIRRTSRLGWLALVVMGAALAACLSLCGCGKKWEILKHSANALQDSIAVAEKWDHDAKRAEIAKCPRGDMPCAVAALERHKAAREPIVRAVDEAAPVLFEASRAIDAGASGDTSALVARILDVTKALTLALAKVLP